MGRKDEDAMEDKDVAIRLQGAYKSYGGAKKGVPVLTGLDMQVEKGRVYGLLGPSGCGKTTLLKCMLGKLKLDQGDVKVFGKTPGDRSSGVPGKKVGYMPQELALFGEFNITETLHYFSRIFGMEKGKFEERMSFLIKFLDLPSRTRALEKMSGGQQRRVSLAVALLHEPQLLILDEPTVGVDPLLRQSIWNHLMSLSNDGKLSTTIVMTTHYTEEAMQAHKVGMMRFGRLLAEGTPANMLAAHGKLSLEDVFLDLCTVDGVKDTIEDVSVSDDVDAAENPILKNAKNSDVEKADEAKVPLTCDDEVRENSDCDEGREKMEGVVVANGGSHKVGTVKVVKNYKRSVSQYVNEKKDRFSMRNVNACMMKTFNRMKKRWGFLIYQFLLPALQISLFCLAIGQDPANLPLGIVTEEVPSASASSCPHTSQCPVETQLSFFTSLGDPTEHLANLSCRYLSFLDTDIIRPQFFSSLEAAEADVEAGVSWGVVHMEKNFSSNLRQRIMNSVSGAGENNNATDIKDVLGGSIKVRLDITSQHIAFTLQLKLVEAFEKFMTQLVTSCGLPEKLAELPLVFDDPIYGDDDLTFTDFMAPGIILTIVHSMALGYSAMIIIIERNEGLMDRTWVAGVTAAEFSLAHFLVSFLINLVQVVLCLIFMICVFQVPAVGNLGLIFLLTILQGMCGTTIGLIISSFCKTQQDATQIALGIFYPNMILSGIIWPLEAMPAGLRYIAYILPQTFACEAMRGMLLRGWGLMHHIVLRGFGVTIAWIIVTYLIFKIRVVRTS